MKYITDVDYIHAKMFCKNFDIKNSGKYQDFYLKSDTLLLVHVFENSRKICVEIYELFPAKFLLAPRLAW